MPQHGLKPHTVLFGLCFHNSHIYLSPPEDIFSLLFRGKGREREKHRLVVSLDQGSNLQTRHVS